MQYMEITDKDDEKSKAKKKKLQKKWKSDQRFAKKDAETQKRQQSWMDFKKGKGSKKKVISAICCFSLCSIRNAAINVAKQALSHIYSACTAVSYDSHMTLSTLGMLAACFQCSQPTKSCQHRRCSLRNSHRCC